jgi:4,5-dihydroxyphthalate decarboxylase
LEFEIPKGMAATRSLAPEGRAFEGILMARELNLTLMLADYHRTRPLLSGGISVGGINLEPRPAVPGEACLRPVYEEFDIAEMSLSWYAMAKCRGEPVIALPVFPMRMFIHPYLFCSSSADIRTPENLKGKKVGMDQYRLTVGLWARGILQEFYGARPEEMLWSTSEPEGAGFHPPKDVSISVREQSVESLLLNGEIDALIAPNVPASFRAGDSRIRRVFGNCRAEITEYFRRTKIFPITHTVVLRESLVAEHPWIVNRLVNAFVEAEKVCRKAYEYPKRLALPSAVLVIEEEEAAFGKDPFQHGLTPQNQLVLGKFLQYAEEQGYISYRPKLTDLFAPVGN